MGEMMSIKVLETKKNPLFKREEVKAVITHDGKPTPKRENIMPSLVTSLKAKAELILIDKIFSIKGKGESTLKVFVYDKKDDMPKNRLDIIEKRKAKRKGDKKEEAAPAETAPPVEGEAPAANEEKPAEEQPVVEAKPEKKSEEPKTEEAPKEEEKPAEEKKE